MNGLREKAHGKYAPCRRTKPKDMQRKKAEEQLYSLYIICSKRLRGTTWTSVMPCLASGLRAILIFWRSIVHTSGCKDKEKKQRHNVAWHKSVMPPCRKTNCGDFCDAPNVIV